jgi:hypothetical protein
VDAGDVLYITGDAQNLFGKPAREIIPDSNVIVTISVMGYRNAQDEELAGLHQFPRRRAVMSHNDISTVNLLAETPTSGDLVHNLVRSRCSWLTLDLTDCDTEDPEFFVCQKNRDSPSADTIVIPSVLPLKPIYNVVRADMGKMKEVQNEVLARIIFNDSVEKITK